MRSILETGFTFQVVFVKRRKRKPSVLFATPWTVWAISIESSGAYTGVVAICPWAQGIRGLFCIGRWTNTAEPPVHLKLRKKRMWSVNGHGWRQCKFGCSRDDKEHRKKWKLILNLIHSLWGNKSVKRLELSPAVQAKHGPGVTGHVQAAVSARFLNFYFAWVSVCFLIPVSCSFSRCLSSSSFLWDFKDSFICFSCFRTLLIVASGELSGLHVASRAVALVGSTSSATGSAAIIWG